MRASILAAFALALSAVSLSAVAVSPRLYAAATKLPDSPVAAWRLRLTKDLGKPVQTDRVQMDWLFLVPVKHESVGESGLEEIVRECAFFPRAAVDADTGMGGAAKTSLFGMVVYTRTPGGPTILPAGDLVLEARRGTGNATYYYAPARSSPTKLVFVSAYNSLGVPWPDETVFELEGLAADPFSGSGGGADSAWTESRVSLYMQWYSDYVLPAMNDIHDHLPDIAEHLNDMKEMLDDAVAPGSNYYEVLLKALYPSSGAPFDGSETSYLQMIAESLSADGTFSDGALTPETADYYPGNFETSPLNTRVKPMFNDAYGWLHGPTMPSEASSRDPHPLGTTGRVQTGFKYRIDLGQFWPSAAGNRMRDVELDLSAFDTVRTLVHVVMSGLFGLFACHRIWDEFRRQ